MADDRIDLVDWADVAAVGAVAAVLAVPGTRAPVASLLADLRREWCRDYRHGFVADVEHIAAALREAHEAGREESRTRVEVAQEVASYLVSILPLTPAAIEIMSKELARLQDENRTLRRELVAISRRRCDGCHGYTEDARLYPADGRCVARGCATMAHDCCSRWEARP